MTRNRFLAVLLTVCMLAFSWTVSSHFHAKESAKTADGCAVCVAGHQVKSGASSVLDKAESPLVAVSSFVTFESIDPSLSLPLSHSPRAPPAS